MLRILKINLLFFAFTISAIAANNISAINTDLVLTESMQISLLKQDTQKLMSFYSVKAGWWQDKNCIHPGGCLGTEQSVWVWANATFAMANYQVFTGDRQYQQMIKAIYNKNWRNIYPKKYFDDDLWWAYALIRVYEVTGDHDALIKAQKLLNYVRQFGTQNVCYGYGGVYWNLAKTEVGTIANMLYVVDNAMLYQITHDKLYRQLANQTWNWYRNSGLLTKTYTVFDHYAINNGACGKLYSWPFTYNVGVLLSALGLLAEINNDPAFINYGKQVAFTSLVNFVNNGIINEPCDDVFECAQNAFLFKGIYVYGLAQFAISTKDPVFIRQIQMILAYNLYKIKQIQNNPEIYAFNWSLPVNYKRNSKLYNPADILSHLSVIYLELGNVLINKANGQTLIKSGVEKRFESIQSW